jgi:hypothetical protein
VNRRAILCGAAAAMLVLGLVLGFMPVGSECGSVFRPDTFGAELRDTLAGSLGGAADECEQDLSNRRIPTYGLLGMAVVAGLIAIAIGPDKSAEQ